MMKNAVLCFAALLATSVATDQGIVRVHNALKEQFGAENVYAAVREFADRGALRARVAAMRDVVKRNDIETSSNTAANACYTALNDASQVVASCANIHGEMFAVMGDDAKLVAKVTAFCEGTCESRIASAGQWIRGNCSGENFGNINQDLTYVVDQVRELQGSVCMKIEGKYCYPRWIGFMGALISASLQARSTSTQSAETIDKRNEISTSGNWSSDGNGSDYNDYSGDASESSINITALMEAQVRASEKYCGPCLIGVLKRELETQANRHGESADDAKTRRQTANIFRLYCAKSFTDPTKFCMRELAEFSNAAVDQSGSVVDMLENTMPLLCSASGCISRFISASSEFGDDDDQNATNASGDSGGGVFNVDRMCLRNPQGKLCIIEFTKAFIVLNKTVPNPALTKANACDGSGTENGGSNDPDAVGVTAIKTFHSSLGCCALPGLKLFNEIGEQAVEQNANATEGHPAPLTSAQATGMAEFMSSSCELTFKRACAGGRAAVRVKLTNVKPEYYAANKDKVNEGFKRDFAGNSGASKNLIKVTNAPATGNKRADSVELDMSVSGFASRTEASNVVNNVFESRDTFLMAKTSESVPESGRVDPLQPISAEEEQALVEEDTEAEFFAGADIAVEAADNEANAGSALATTTALVASAVACSTLF